MASSFSTLFILLVFIALSEAGRRKPCARTLRPPRGFFGFPPERQGKCMTSFTWEMRLKKKQSLRVHFYDVDLKNSRIKVQGKRFARKDYEDIQVVAMETTEVIIQPPTKFVKISIEGAEGFFGADYEVFYCDLPPKSLTKGDCSRFGYRKYSVCDFQCDTPNFYPVSPSNMNIRARCRGDHTWSRDLDQSCVSLAEFEDLCFDNDSKQNCAFDQGQLFKLFEKKLDLRKYLPLIAPTPSPSPSSSPEDLRSSRRSVDIETLLYEDDPVVAVCLEVEACPKVNGEYLHPKCGAHPIKEYREPCFVCRNVIKVCQEHVVFAQIFS